MNFIQFKKYLAPLQNSFAGFLVDIYCAGGIRDVKEDDLWRGYESFNVSGFIDETPYEWMNKEMDELFYQIWEHIKCKEGYKEYNYLWRKLWD